MTPGRRSCQALCRPAHATATTSDVRSSPVFLGPTPHRSAPNLCHIAPTPLAASSHETSPKYASLASATPHTSVVLALSPAFAQNQSVCWRASCLLHPLHRYAYSCPQ